jgi:hypothetical protein
VTLDIVVPFAPLPPAMALLITATPPAAKVTLLTVPLVPVEIVPELYIVTGPKAGTWTPEKTPPENTPPEIDWACADGKASRPQSIPNSKTFIVLRSLPRSASL